MKPVKSYFLLSRMRHWTIGSLLLLLCFFPVLSGAQITDSIGFSSPGSVYLQSNQLFFMDSLRLNYGLKNFGNSTFTGSVTLEMIIRDSTNAQIFAGPIDTLTLSMAPGDTSQRFLTTIEVNPTRFAAGGGVVVIWPSRPGQGFADSVSLPIQVSNGPVALSPALPDAVPFNIFPNPGNGEIFYQFSDPNYKSDYVLVLDLLGKCLISEACSDTRILNLSDRLSRGTYLLVFFQGEIAVSQHCYLRE
jgi:hypothetical protein